MDAITLRYFVAVADVGSMSAAAGLLNTVQSNVTTRIKGLESELGIELFERTPRGVVLTPAGSRLLPHAKSILGAFHDARACALDEGPPSGPLVVGSLETTIAMRLAPRLTVFLRDYREVDLVLRPGTTAELLSRVLDRQVDGAFVCAPVSHPDISSRTVFEEELVLATGAGIASASEALDQRELNVIVLRVGCSYREHLERMLQSSGRRGFRVMEFGTLEAILACTSAGLGITLLPRKLIELGQRTMPLRSHSVPNGVVRTDFIQRIGSQESKAMSAFLSVMTDVSAHAQAAE